MGPYFRELPLYAGPLEVLYFLQLRRKSPEIRLKALLYSTTHKLSRRALSRFRVYRG